MAASGQNSCPPPGRFSCPLSLGNWVAKAKENGVVQVKPLDVNERAELKRLREENRVVKMERDFLKKAAAFFASQHQ